MTGGRHRAHLGRHLPMAAVVAGVAAGVALTSRQRWEEGLYVVGGAALLGALLRLVLPARRVGLLAVRSRLLDVVVLAGLGGAVIALAAVVPEG